MKMIEKWSEKLLDEKPFNTINEVVKAFKSAILNVVPRKKSVRTAYRVDGSECNIIIFLVRIEYILILLNGF